MAAPEPEVVAREPEAVQERVLAPQIAATLRSALLTVVEHGTARRLGPTLALSDGSTLAFGGKTGTGDNRFEVFAPGGRLVLYVPQGPGLFSPLDEALGHRRRYRKEGLAAELREAGWRVETMRDFNRVSVPGWWLNGKVLRRRDLGRLQLKGFNMLLPLLRGIDPVVPAPGLGILATAVRED